MRRIAVFASLLAALGVVFAATAGADNTREYKIEMYNAFGIVEGSDVRVAGVNAGNVTDLEINEEKRAVVTVELNGELAELGTETRCSSEPQSLIAEYFIDCDPQGPPMEEGDIVPASRVSQTVQQDLVQSTLREPYKQRLRLLINEFGTALAGNPDSLNEAVRLGAPALTETRKATQILASQNRIIRDLNVDSDQVIAELARVRNDAVEFVDEAEDAASASAARREDLSQDFALLDDFLGELEPTLAELESVAREQTPLLTDLRASASGLTTLSTNLPAFSNATEGALTSLGDAANVGRKALNRGRDEIDLLADASRKAPLTAEGLADFASDIDDPRRTVEIDQRAGTDTGRTSTQPERKNTMGYTGFESLLNWTYYLTGTSAQFDQVAHTMHINLNAFETGNCSHASSGRDEEGHVGVPTEDGGRTTNILDAARCVQWLGPNQPGINEEMPLPPYDPSVCPDGTEPPAALELCNPANAARTSARAGSPSERGGRGTGTNPGQSTPETTAPGDSAGDGDGGGGDGAGAGDEGPIPDNLLDDILNLPQDALEDLPQSLQDELRNLGSGLRRGLDRNEPRGASAGPGGLGGNTGAVAEELLDFLFSN
jgi:ABC-type transporter Mla subunit MlaD